MAKKDDRKKQKKRLKERNKAKAHAKYRAEKAKAERYPEFVFETSEGNGYFVAEVRAVAETLDFNRRQQMGLDCERRLKSAARGGRKVQRWGWVAKSPFADLRLGSQANPARACYAPLQTIMDVLDACSSMPRQDAAQEQPAGAMARRA